MHGYQKAHTHTHAHMHSLTHSLTHSLSHLLTHGDLSFSLSTLSFLKPLLTHCTATELETTPTHVVRMAQNYP